MSDLFWIIPSIVLGITAMWLLGVWVVSVFKNNEWRDILGWVIVSANVLSLISLGVWMIGQSSQGMSTAGFLLIVFTGLVFTFTVFGSID